MKPKTINIIYWIGLILFCAFFTMDAFGGLTKQEAGVQVMQQLGYPVYFMTIVSIAKLMGVVALLQNRFTTVKEWAFAGFTINFIGASLSWLFYGESAFAVLFPLIPMAVMFVVYTFWKKKQQLQGKSKPAYGNSYAVQTA